MFFRPAACLALAGASLTSLPACTTAADVQTARLTVSEEQRPFVTVDEAKVAIVGASLIDGSGTASRDDQTILMENGKIVWVGETADAPIDGHRRIDGRGATVIPGIVGMHDHLHRPGTTYTAFSSTRLWLAGGVTTVQTAGAAEAERELELARAIEEDGALGPEIFASAPFVTGPGGNGPMDKPKSEQEARAFVREWAAKGVSWFKLYRHTEPAIASAIIDEAHRLGLRTTGHLCSISYGKAAEMGIDRLEHGLNAMADFVEGRSEGECVSNRAAIDALEMDDPRLIALVDTLVRNDVVVGSTLPIIESSYPARFHIDARILDALSPEQRARAEAAREAGRHITDEERKRTERYIKVAAFERLFAQRGGTLVTGPDPGRHIVPGYGNQRAAELLYEAGFTMPEVIRIMTANGAETLGAGDRIGRIAVGYEADIVLLEGNLAKDASAINRPRIVFSNGLGYDPTALARAASGQVGIR